MATGVFYKDLKIGNITEQEVIEIFKKNGCKDFTTCNTNKQDFKCLNSSGEVITVEVKEDFMCEKTGNVSLEFYSNGKDSGIAVSKADWYVYKIHTKAGIKFYIFRTSKLKDYITNHKVRTVNGCENGKNKMYLFDYGTFTHIGSELKI